MNKTMYREETILAIALGSSEVIGMENKTTGSALLWSRC
jgi:hypothetical protein